MKINIIGGGPAGLYFAILMKKADPAGAITVVERDGPNDTFGWGIVFSDQTMHYLADGDTETHDAIAERMQRWDNVDVNHRDERITIRGNRFSGIARIEFLSVLQRRALDLGVDVRFRTDVAAADLARLDAECDLLIGSDGANSLVRRTHEELFRPTVEMGRNRFVWLGTRHLFNGLTLTFRQHATGVYAAHSYKFSRSHSTFIVECNDATWTAAGFERMTPDETCDFLAGVFGADLGGESLLHNNFFQWRRFPLVRCGRWQDGRRVLLGDALHTAHFSIGSGTKLALEDSIALFRCFQSKPAAAAASVNAQVAAALEEYERVRKPEIESYQEAAQSSLLWFETVADRMHLAPMELAHQIMTRSGRIDEDRLRRRDPEFMAAFERWKTGETAKG